MSERDGSSDSEAPEEITVQEGLQQDEELRKAQKASKDRVVLEGKQRRREWAEKLTPRPPQKDSAIKKKRPSRKDENVEGVIEPEAGEKSQDDKGMLPDDIVKLIVAREKKVFSSDSEEEEPKPTSRKKRAKKSGKGTVILDEIPPPQCLQSSLEFLHKRKMQIPRSSAVLNNSNQALRLLSSSGLLSRK